MVAGCLRRHWRRRLLYRSKQRGWLEMDIMLGNWAAANLPRLQEAELQQFQEVIDMENPDLYKYLTGQVPVPEEVRDETERARTRRLGTARARGPHATHSHVSSCELARALTVAQISPVCIGP